MHAGRVTTSAKDQEAGEERANARISYWLFAIVRLAAYRSVLSCLSEDAYSLLLWVLRSFILDFKIIKVRLNFATSRGIRARFFPGLSTLSRWVRARKLPQKLGDQADSNRFIRGRISKSQE